MAPRNKAKRQQGSFLTRGRQQVQRRQELRQQSSRQLPPQGGTSAGSPKASAQRLTKAVGERARMDVARTRALGDMLQRNAARNDRAEGVKEGMRMTSGKTRYVPPGGENAKGQASLPQGKRGGEMRQKGGPLATTQRGGAMTQRGGGAVSRTNTGGPVDRVSVRDMGNTPQRRVGGSTPRVLNPASGQIGQPGADRRMLPQGQTAGTPSSSSPATRGRIGMGGVGGALALAAGQAAVGPLARAGGQALAGALRPVGRAIDDRMKGVNSKDEAQRIQRATPLPRPTERQQRAAVRLPQAQPSDVGRKQEQRSTQSSSRTSERSRSRVSTPVRSTSTSQSSAPKERRVSAATANRESGNYGTSRSDNKLLGEFLRERMRQREGANPNAIGPVSDGNTYAGNLKPTTGRGPVSSGAEYGNMLKISKAKEDQKKKKK